MSKERPNPKLEYNLAGGLLLTIREGDFQDLYKGLISAGYTHACILPFRTLTKKERIEELKISPLRVIHMEEAWNPTNEDNLAKAVLAGFLGYYKRFRGVVPGPPIVQDSFFPSKSTCERLFRELFKAFSEAKFISHEIETNFPSDRLLVEIHDGLQISSAEILDLTEEKGIGLVFDPRHLLAPEKMISTPHKPTRVQRGEWERQYLSFASQIEVVDINPPDKNDIQDLLKGRGILSELTAAAKTLGSVKFLRVEIPMPIATQIPMSPIQQRGFDYLKQIGEALKSA